MKINLDKEDKSRWEYFKSILSVGSSDGADSILYLSKRWTCQSRSSDW
jgi:hypothetical protein